MKLAELLKPRQWKARCPDCHGRATRTEGCWSSTSTPRVVWTCPTCNGSGEVDVQLADSTQKEGQTDA